MVCDLNTGRCDLPSEQQGNSSIATSNGHNAGIELLYMTDPMCSHCWGMEPIWRKFLYVYGAFVNVRYIYGGLLESWSGFSRGGITSPADLVPHFAEVAEQYGQPIDSALWNREHPEYDPPESSYPASRGLHIVRLLNPSAEPRFLRLLRQAVFIERRNTARSEVIAACAADAGVDRAAFFKLWKEGAGDGPFEQDLQETQLLGVRGFPTYILRSANNQALVLPGTQSFLKLKQALEYILEKAPRPRPIEMQDVLNAYISGTTREFAEILGFSDAEMERVLEEEQVSRKSLVTGALWTVATCERFQTGSRAG